MLIFLFFFCFLFAVGYIFGIRKTANITLTIVVSTLNSRPFIESNPSALKTHTHTLLKSDREAEMTVLMGGHFQLSFFHFTCLLVIRFIYTHIRPKFCGPNVDFCFACVCVCCLIFVKTIANKKEKNPKKNTKKKKKWLFCCWTTNNVLICAISATHTIHTHTHNHNMFQNGQRDEQKNCQFACHPIDGCSYTRIYF